MAFEFPAEDDPSHPKLILERLFSDCPEFAEIAELEPQVAVIFRNDEVIKAGKVRLGTCYIPQVQGELRPLFTQLLEDTLGFAPDFLIVLSKTFWDASTDREREVLVFHEAMHIGQELDKYGVPRFSTTTGDPIWGIRAHDIEEFDAVIRRYGAWKSDLVQFLEAAREGGAR